MTDNANVPDRIWIQTNHIPDQCDLDKWHIEPDANEAEQFTAYRRVEHVEASLASVSALIEAAKDTVDGWDWWQKDQYDRCQSVPGDAIDDLRAALAAIAKAPK